MASHLQGFLTPFYLPPFCSRIPAAMVKVAGAMGKSAEVMKTVNSLMKVADVQKAMQEMSKGAFEVKAEGRGWVAFEQQKGGRGRLHRVSGTGLRQRTEFIDVQRTIQEVSRLWLRAGRRRGIGCLATCAWVGAGWERVCGAGTQLQSLLKLLMDWPLSRCDNERRGFGRRGQELLLRCHVAHVCDNFSWSDVLTPCIALPFSLDCRNDEGRVDRRDDERCAGQRT